MRAAFVICATAILAACDNGQSNQSLEPEETASASDSPRSAQAGALPEPGPVPRFVGRWAADEKSCQSAAWQFTATTLRTPAGSNCSFDKINEVPGGYDVEATCTAEGPPTPDLLKIRFAESAKAMLFESKTIADSGLVYCGRDV